jgi:Putative bacterial sensory transduction regulator
MKTTLLFRQLAAPLAVCAVLSLAAGAASAQTYTKQQLQTTYSDFLATEGFRPELTQNGNVRFRREGRSYVIYVDADDPTYFRLVLAFSADDKSPQARIRRLEGINTASNEVKVVKAFLDNDGDPTFAAEMFLVVPGDFKTTLTRLLRAMDNAYDKYTKKVAATP